MKKFESAGKVSVFKTACFSVKLSKRKANIIDTQMRISEDAYYKALDSVKHHVQPMLKLETKGRKQALSQIKKELPLVIKPLPLSTASKASIVEEVAAQISSTVELIHSGQQANLPSPKDRDSDFYQDGLKMLIDSIDIDSENQARDLMAKKAYDGMPRPLGWLKTRKSDGAMIMKDDKGRFFVYLNSHSSKSKFSKQKIKVSEMLNTREGELQSFTSSTGILAPLKMSKWHEDEYINKGQAKSYRLVKLKDGYALLVSFQFEVDRVETETALGVDRGIDALAAYSVTKGRSILEQGIYSGMELKAYQRKMEERHKVNQKKGRTSKKKWKAYGDHMIFKIAKSIVQSAVKHKSQVMLEDLTSISNGHHKKRAFGARRSNFSRMLSRQQYQKLQAVLTYKLKCEGLPEPKLINAAGTSITCNKCGNKTKENRKTQSLFKCTVCNHEVNADIHASANISMKLGWFQEHYNKPKRKMSISFCEYLSIPI